MSMLQTIIEECPLDHCTYSTDRDQIIADDVKPGRVGSCQLWTLTKDNI